MSPIVSTGGGKLSRRKVCHHGEPSTGSSRSRLAAAGVIAVASLVPVFMPALEVRPQPEVNVQVHQVCTAEGNAVCRFER